jgi:hypothetical protein
MRFFIALLKSVFAFAFSWDTASGEQQDVAELHAPPVLVGWSFKTDGCRIPSKNVLALSQFGSVCALENNPRLKIRTERNLFIVDYSIRTRRFPVFNLKDFYR